MTKQDTQKMAISRAVSDALRNIGLEKVRTGEFFGTNQRSFEEDRLAA